MKTNIVLIIVITCSICLSLYRIYQNNEAIKQVKDLKKEVQDFNRLVNKLNNITKEYNNKK